MRAASIGGGFTVAGGTPLMFWIGQSRGAMGMSVSMRCPFL
jgi:hypothetical protein